MISASDQVVSLCVRKVSVEVVICELFTLCRFDEHEAERGVSDGGVTQFLPIDAVLIMADVDAPHLVAFGVLGLTVDGTPTEAEGADEEIVEQADVGCRDEHAAEPQKPGGEATEEMEDPPPSFRGSFLLALSRGLALSSPGRGMRGLHLFLML
jgi:hypothetical protein